MFDSTTTIKILKIIKSCKTLDQLLSVDHWMRKISHHKIDRYGMDWHTTKRPTMLEQNMYSNAYEIHSRLQDQHRILFEREMRGVK